MEDRRAPRGPPDSSRPEAHSRACLPQKYPSIPPLSSLPSAIRPIRPDIRQIPPKKNWDSRRNGLVHRCPAAPGNLKRTRSHPEVLNGNSQQLIIDQSLNGWLKNLRIIQSDEISSNRYSAYQLVTCGYFSKLNVLLNERNVLCCLDRKRPEATAVLPRRTPLPPPEELATQSPTLDSTTTCCTTLTTVLAE